LTDIEHKSDEVPPGLSLASPGVYYASGGFACVDGTIVSFLKIQAALAPRRRARLCLHTDPGAAQHDMLIVMHRSSYVAPHCHLSKSESLALIEGSCDLFLFDGSGQVLRTVLMAADPQAGCFLYRMPQSLFHTLRFKTEWTVFIESTIGPFDRRDTGVATWAPPETDPDAGHRYLDGLTASRA